MNSLTVKIFLIVSQLQNCVLTLQSFRTIPTYSEANKGDNVVLRCEVENKGGECRWEKDGTPVGIFPSKYEWAGDVKSGNCSILILDVEAEYDDGVWQCQVTASDFKRGDSLISDGAELVVRSPPTELYFVSKQGRVDVDVDQVIGHAGGMMDIKCVTTGANPVPKLSFTIDGEPVTTINTQINKRSSEGGWESSLQLSYIPRKDQDGSVLGCSAQHEALKSPLESEANLNIFYSPTVTGIAVNQTSPNRGESVSLDCQVESNPPAKISWKRLTNTGVVIGHGGHLVISNIQPTMNDIYICEAENEVGISDMRSDPIKTNHAPIIRHIGPSPNIMLIRGQSMTLTCSAEASPAPSYQWLQHTLAGHVVVREESRDTLIVDNVDYADAGQYFCQASNTVAGKVMEALSDEIVVEIRGAPVLSLENSLEEIDVVEGDTLEVRIKFCSNPTPMLSWKFGRKILDENDRLTFGFERRVDDHCAIAALKLDSVTLDDAGQYVLTVENEHGKSDQKISINVIKILFTREIIIAIIAGSVLTIILLVFIIVSRCRSKSEEPVKDVESCGTSTTSDNNKNEKMESDEETMEFNESYEKFAPDIIPSNLLKHKQGPYRPSYNDLCHYPQSSNGGSMRVNDGKCMDQMIHMYNSNILEHINTMSYTSHHNQDNIYYWRQNFDNEIYT